MRLLLALALVATLAAPASALDTRTFARSASAPHVPSLVAALSPALLAGSLHVTVQPNGANYAVVIGAGSWSGVSLAAVQAAVDAAPADTPAVRAQFDVDGTHGLAACLVEAFARALLPVLNDARQNPTTQRAALTAAQVRTTLKNEIDALGCGG